MGNKINTTKKMVMMFKLRSFGYFKYRYLPVTIKPDVNMKIIDIKVGSITDISFWCMKYSFLRQYNPIILNYIKLIIYAPINFKIITHNTDINDIIIIIRTDNAEGVQ